MHNNGVESRHFVVYCYTTIGHTFNLTQNNIISYVFNFNPMTNFLTIRIAGLLRAITIQSEKQLLEVVCYNASIKVIIYNYWIIKPRESENFNT